LPGREFTPLRSQFCDLKHWRSGRRSLPGAFNKHSAIMPAILLNSKQPVEMGVFVLPAFVRSRQTLAGAEIFAGRITELPPPNTLL
jgi:hypothetical protein